MNLLIALVVITLAAAVQGRSIRRRSLYQREAQVARLSERAGQWACNAWNPTNQICTFYNVPGYAASYFASAQGTGGPHPSGYNGCNGLRRRTDRALRRDGPCSSDKDCEEHEYCEGGRCVVEDPFIEGAGVHASSLVELSSIPSENGGKSWLTNNRVVGDGPVTRSWSIEPYTLKTYKDKETGDTGVFVDPTLWMPVAQVHKILLGTEGRPSDVEDQTALAVGHVLRGAWKMLTVDQRQQQQEAASKAGSSNGGSRERTLAERDAFHCPGWNGFYTQADTLCPYCLQFCLYNVVTNPKICRC